MTNNSLEKYIMGHVCPRWDVRYDASRSQKNSYPYLDYEILKRSPVDEFIQQITKEKKYMFGKEIYAIANHEGVAKLTSRNGNFSTDFVIESIATSPDIPIEIHGYIPGNGEKQVETIKTILYDSTRRTINPKYIGEKLIKKVIFNDPATIVFWDDGTKTIVKTQNGEVYDPEKGLAMAITKKALGNEGNYYDTFTKWLKESEEVKG